MLELICHQRYRVSGVPTDLTPYRNHGVAIDTTSAPGVTVGAQAIGFPNPDSRVAIARGPYGAWAPLGALRIEVVAKLDPAAARGLVLAEGDGAFAFSVDETALAATVQGPGGTGMHIRSADADSPDGAFHAVPANRWVTLLFDYDGFARMRLAIDGRDVAEKLFSGGIVGVQPGGVAIGNRVAGGEPLLGEVDEVRVWRSDPNAIRREFLCRPFDAKTARCWEVRARALGAWMTKEPARAAALGALVQRSNDRLVRALLLLPPSEQLRVRAALKAMTALWCKGAIDGRAMKHALKRWFDELRRAGVDPSDGHAPAEIEALLSTFDRSGLDLACDPAATAFLAMMAHAVTADVRARSHG